MDLHSRSNSTDQLVVNNPSHIIPLQVVTPQQAVNNELEVEGERQKRITKKKGEEDEMHRTWVARIKDTRDAGIQGQYRKKKVEELKEVKEAQKSMNEHKLPEKSLEEYLEVLVHREMNLRYEIQLMDTLHPDLAESPKRKAVLEQIIEAANGYVGNFRGLVFAPHEHSA